MTSINKFITLVFGSRGKAFEKLLPAVRNKELNNWIRSRYFYFLDREKVFKERIRWLRSFRCSAVRQASGLTASAVAYIMPA